MKRILSTALAIALFVGAAQAQVTEENNRHMGRRKDMAMEQLDLTADQKAKVQSIREAQRKELQALEKNDQMTVKQWKEKRKELQEKYQAQYQAVLTPAQLGELKKRKAEHNEKGFDRRGEQFRNQGAFLSKELSLSAEQQTKVRNIFQEFRTKAQAIRANNSLTQEQKKEQMHSLSGQYMDQAKAVLNAEQLKRFEELKKKHKQARNKNL